MNIIPPLKNNENLEFTTTKMDLEVIMWVKQVRERKYHTVSLICEQTKNNNKKTEAHRYSEQIDSC